MTKHVSPKKRFAVGAQVRIIMPGINGVVIELNDRPTGLGEYWHKIQTEHGDRNEPGSNLELVPRPMTNSSLGAIPKAPGEQNLLSPEQAISLLRSQLEEPVEQCRYDDFRIDSWERITLAIVERTFGQRTRNASHFSASVSHYHETEAEAQDEHVRHIESRKEMIRSFIKELEIIPASSPPVDVTRQGVFFAGQTFDALSSAVRIFGTAKASLVLIDGYLGADTLSLVPTFGGITIKILTKPLSPTLKTLCQAFEAQHGSLAVRSSSAFHDRFVLIDDAFVYHFGASFKDLGKKTFMFSRIEEPEIIATIRAKFTAEWNAATVEI